MSKYTFALLIPVYNEEKTIEKVLKKVNSLDFVDEIIIVDDGSKDKSFEIAKNFESSKIKVYSLGKNKGKTAAIDFAIKKSTSEVLAIQDADLEYDPTELKDLIEPINNDIADVVFGSRFLVKKAARVLYFYHYLANKFLTFLSNILTNHNMTDIETCYKVFKKELIQNYDLKSSHFGMEVELTSLFTKLNCRIYEAPISYYGRTYEEGKKIGLKDGLWAIYYIFYFNLIYHRFVYTNFKKNKK